MMSAFEASNPNEKRYRKVKLFGPLELRSVTARNRIMTSPMSQYSAPDSIPTDWHYVHLGTRAVGGAGIVMTEATAVEPRGRISPWDVGLWSDEQETAFERIAAFVSEQGAILGVQLAHAGRKASHMRPWEDRKPIFREDGGWETVAPSPLPLNADDIVPTELTTDQISEILSRYKDSAQRALRAGFKLIEIHAAHGYLPHSFLSPLTNHRSDDYGGSFDSRVKVVLEVAKTIREVWPDELPLFARISVKDWVDGRLGCAGQRRTRQTAGAAGSRSYRLLERRGGAGAADTNTSWISSPAGSSRPRGRGDQIRGGGSHK